MMIQTFNLVPRAIKGIIRIFGQALKKIENVEKEVLAAVNFDFFESEFFG